MAHTNGVDLAEVRRYMAFIGRLGGAARLGSTTHEQRKRWAKKAAKARWGRRKRKASKGL